MCSSEAVQYCTIVFKSLTLPIADITLHCQCDSLCNFLLIFYFLFVFFLFLMSLVAYSITVYLVLPTDI